MLRRTAKHTNERPASADNRHLLWPLLEECKFTNELYLAALLRASYGSDRQFGTCGPLSGQARPMPSTRNMTLYQHDGPLMFRFQIEGDLDGPCAVELEQAWLTAAPIMDGKQLVVDISGIDQADASGMALLVRFRDAGARFRLASRPGPLGIASSLGLASDSSGAGDDQHEPAWVSTMWSRMTRTFHSMLHCRQC